MTLPKAIRDLLNVGPGDRVVFWQADDGRVIVEPQTLGLDHRLVHRQPRAALAVAP